MVDNDLQGNLTAAVGLTPAEQKYALTNLLLAAIDYSENITIHIQRTLLPIKDGLDLIPANRRLADAAARLQVMQLSQYNAVGNSARYCEKVMSELLLSVTNEYDYIIIYIIIDCGLQHELLTINALAASDLLHIPVQAHFLASEGILNVLDMVCSVQSRFNPNLQIAGILLTMYQSRPQLCQCVKESVGEIYGGDFHCSSGQSNTLSR